MLPSTSYLRQRVKRGIDDLTNDPRPAASKLLDVSELEELDCEIRRLRIDPWRIVYAITEVDKIVGVLALRKRSPYDYGDLEEILRDKS